MSPAARPTLNGRLVRLIALCDKLAEAAVNVLIRLETPVALMAMTSNDSACP
jgi:hypothetical protein